MIRSAIALSLLATAVGCESAPDGAAAAFLAAADQAPLCAKFPPDIGGDPNATACTGHTGDQTVYCHLHTGGRNQDGCEDLPGGGSPQLHCKVHGGGETYTPVYGGTLDCGDDDDAPDDDVPDDDVPDVPDVPEPEGPVVTPDVPAAIGDTTIATPTARTATTTAAAPAPPRCDDRYAGIPVTLTYPAQGAACQCCVMPSTNSPANTDCSDHDSHCLEVRLGCAMPDLSDAAKATLCDALARANAGEADYTCMNKPCDFTDNQQCKDVNGTFVSCETLSCCDHLDWRTEMTLAQCYEEGGRPASGEDCFGPGQPPVVRPPREIRHHDF